MKDKLIPLHRYMLTFQAVFRGPEGQAGMKVVNTTINRSKKNIPLGKIKQAQDGVAIQLRMLGIDPDHIVDIAFMSCSYLGHMNEIEFTEGMTDEQSASVDISTSSQSSFLIME